jgi:GNAT superfamily N-acetyltransferase
MPLAEHVLIERLNPQHQRSDFDCGEPLLNDFLQRQAGQLARKGYGKTYVALRAGNPTVIGFLTLSVGQLEAAYLSPHLKLPRYPAPVMRIGRLAVSLTAQGQGVGQHLMAFALRLSLEFSQQAGLYAVLVEAKHAKAKAFYETLGFVPTLDIPLLLYLPISMLQKNEAHPP